VKQDPDQKVRKNGGFTMAVQKKSLISNRTTVKKAIIATKAGAPTEPAPTSLTPTKLHPTKLHPTKLHPTKLHPTKLHPFKMV
jgi:hypothetical protein